MRKKVLKLIITFPNTQQAIAFEKKCQDFGIGERLIPVPGDISSGCGLAWKSELENKSKLEKIYKENNIEIEGVYQTYLFERYVNKDE